MPNPSNLYAEKVFAEHPISLWSLDDDLEYISFAQTAHSDVSLWSTAGGVLPITFATAPENTPTGTDAYLASTPYTDPVVTPFVPYAITSQQPISISDMNLEKETFTIGAHFYIDNSFPDVLSIAIGFYAFDTVTLQGYENTRTYSFPATNGWNYLSDTFLLSSIGENEQVFPYIKVLIKQPEESLSRPADTIPASFDIYISKVTIGQWAENFAFSTNGQVPSVTGLSSQIYGIGSDQLAIPAKEYGISIQDGYYLTKGYSLLCQNFGVPMVYGASNVTRIKPYEGYPSLVFPGNGFLNESGRYQNLTAEMWLRVDSSAVGPRRVFGPVASDDGIYLDGPFLKFKLDNNIGSHYLGESFRPMLIHIRLTENNASVLVNGEEVISFGIASDVVYPSLSMNNLEQDWLAFYAYDDLPLVELDCFAIYPYVVPALVAKRRFAYGQAVELPENINSAFSGTSAYFDYNFADYTNNYNYPDTGKWYQGNSDNMDTESGTLSVPSYSLPEIYVSSGTSDAWVQSLAALQDSDSNFMSFINNPGYFYYNNFRFLNDDLRAFYMIFEVPELPTEKQVLFRITDNVNTNYFEAMIDGGSVKYNLFYNNEEILLYQEDNLIPNTKSFAGIDLEVLENYFGRTVSAFFGNKTRLSAYVASDRDLAHPFSGKIYSVNFCTDRNYQKIASLFQDPEIASTDFVADAGDSYFGAQSIYWYKTFDGGYVDSFALEDNHIASYSLRLRSSFQSFALDIMTNSYWEDYVALKHFAQYVSSASGSYYDLDFIQLNLDYPNRHITSGNYFDTSNEQVKSYVTFQSLASGANAPDDFFTNIEPMPSNSVISPGTNWLTTKYEVVDGSIIYMPPNISFNDVAIVMHIEITTDGIFSSPIKIRKLELASQAYNAETSNPIGTRFGLPVYPYKKYGVYYDYKSKNPYRITKRQHPYLHLTASSGIEKVGENDPSIDRGLSIPMNQNLSESYRVVAMQFAMRYSGDTFGTARQRIMEIETKSPLIRVYLENNDSSGNRARIYAINAKTGQELTDVIFYINGNQTTSPVISVHEWNMIGIRFQDILDLDSYVGSIRINGYVLVNNISFYQSTNLQELQRQEFYNWFNITVIDPIDPYWSTVLSKLPFWNNVLVKSTVNTYGVSPDDIYKTYIGTNKIIVDDNLGISLENYQYSVYSDIELVQTSHLPV